MELQPTDTEYKVFGPHLPGCNTTQDCMCREIATGNHTLHPKDFSPHTTHCQEP